MSFKTDDLNLAAWLAMNHPIVEVEWRGPTAYWCFEPDEQLEDDVLAFNFEEEALVHPRPYAEKITQLKREVGRARDARQAHRAQR